MRVCVRHAMSFQAEMLAALNNQLPVLASHGMHGAYGMSKAKAQQVQLRFRYMCHLCRRIAANVGVSG